MDSALGLTLFLFVVIWLLTFFPAWWLLLRLLAMSVSASGLTAKFWFLLVLYRILIAAPYVVLLLTGGNFLPEIVQIIVVGFIVGGAVFSVIRFLFKNRIIDALWWLYGFVYDGLLHYAPYRRLLLAVTTLAHTVQPTPSAILELGSGTGNVITSLKQIYPKASIVAVDKSSSMTRIARRKHPEIDIRKEDLQVFLSKELSNSYDLIIMQNVLYVVEGRDRLWAELHRVLRTNGSIVITNSDRPGSSSITKEHLAYGKWYELLSPKLLCVGLIDAFISQLSKSGSFFFLSEQQIRDEVKLLFEMSDVDRVYGGVNILFTLKKDNHV